MCSNKKNVVIDNVYPDWFKYLLLRQGISCQELNQDFGNRKYVSYKEYWNLNKEFYRNSLDMFDGIQPGIMEYYYNIKRVFYLKLLYIYIYIYIYFYYNFNFIFILRLMDFAKITNFRRWARKHVNTRVKLSYYK